jgi:hypothetical protein
MTDGYEFTDQYNERINEAYDLDLSDLVIDPEAMNSWVQALVENGVQPNEIMHKARAKYDPDTKDLFLSVPVKGGDQDKRQQHMVFVLQDDYWRVDTSGHVLQ